MKRKITMFTKKSGASIQGISPAANGIKNVYVGMLCPSGGRISEMELVNGTAIKICKRDDKGNPVRDFGMIALDERGKTVHLLADGLIYPLADTCGVLYEDVDDRPKGKAEKDAE